MTHHPKTEDWGEMVNCGDDDIPIMQAIERNITEQWENIREQYPVISDMENLQEFVQFFGYGDLASKNAVFREVACRFAESNDEICWQLLILIFKKDLGIYASMGFYFIESRTAEEKWFSIIWATLQIIKLGISGGYGYETMRKMVLSAVKKEATRHKSSNHEAEMQNYRDELVQKRQTENALWKEREQDIMNNHEYAEYLKRNLQPMHWNVLNDRYVLGQTCREYAELHGVTYESAKKLLTRARNLAVCLLQGAYPDVFK